jgi:hypothetical protein
MALSYKKAMGLCTHGFLLISKQKYAWVRVPKVVIKTKYRYFPIHSYNFKGNSVLCQGETILALSAPRPSFHTKRLTEL